MDPTRKIRIFILGIVLLLTALGIVMIYSASAIYSDQRYGDSMYFLKRHLLSVGIGLLGAIGVMVLDLHRIRRAIPILLGLMGVSLVLIFFTREVGGARRWFPLLGFHIQPSEFAKLVLVLYLADAMTRLREDLNDFKKSILPMSAVVGILIGLVLLQPDLGASVAMGMIFLILLFSAGLRLRYFMGLLGLGFVVFATAVAVEPYRMKRLVTFMRPWEDIQGSGFQLWQSFLALGSGGLGGIGLGQSRQKLFYLPAAHTDFIFSIIGEELGFLGAGLVILLFLGFVACGFTVVFRCPNRFGQLLSLGIVSLIGIEALMNVGVSIGALPTKGLPLPFVSYGGSSVISKLVAVGFLLNVSRDLDLHWKERPVPLLRQVRESFEQAIHR